jgi:hypothetical protein
MIEPLSVKVRPSRGVPNFVWLLMFLALCIVFMQGTFVVMTSGWHRVWPSIDSVKVDLEKQPPPFSN